MKEWMKEWLDKWVDDEWIKELTNGWICQWIDKKINVKDCKKINQHKPFKVKTNWIGDANILIHKPFHVLRWLKNVTCESKSRSKK